FASFFTSLASFFAFFDLLSFLPTASSRASMRCETEVHFSERGAIMKPQSLGSGRPWGAELFPNRGGRVANPFDCARQLIFGNAKMPAPIFNMVLMLDNDFAAVNICLLIIFFAPLAIHKTNGVVWDSFRLTALDGRPSRQ